jgi:hypothetical protein
MTSRFMVAFDPAGELRALKRAFAGLLTTR